MLSPLSFSLPYRLRWVVCFCSSSLFVTFASLSLARRILPTRLPPEKNLPLLESPPLPSFLRETVAPRCPSSDLTVVVSGTE